MNITIINDCRDPNAVGRQIARTASLFGTSTVSFIGVSNDLEAAGNLIDILDSLENRPGVILVNVAPRNGRAKKWPNGTPFGYFWYENILVVASIDGLTLSLVKKLGLIDVVHVLDIPKSLDRLIENKIIPRGLRGSITDSQFRSYDFLPRIASFLVQNKDIESTELRINEIPDVHQAIWWVDNFGNCKTTILSDETIYKPGQPVKTNLGCLHYVKKLKDVPDQEPALIVGSSGIKNRRFLEIVIQGGSVSERFNLHSGDFLSNG